MWTCSYRNDSPRMVILRCVGEASFFQEKVVFPFELWSFDCPPDSELQVWGHEPGGAELMATHPAAELRVASGSDGGADPGVLGSNGLVAGPGGSIASVGMH